MISSDGVSIKTIEDIENLEDLTESELQDLLGFIDDNNKDIIKNDYMSFLRDAHPIFQEGKHIKLIVDKLNWFMDEGQKDKDFLVLSVPPQHGKSMTVTETFPAWYLLNHPKARIGVIGYGTDFAKNKFGRAIKDKLERYCELFGLKMSSIVNRPDHCRIAGHNGFFQTFGINSEITGNSLDLVIVDDPLKGRSDANSQTIRDKTWAEFRDSIISRRQAHTKIIIIMTRWHEDDLAGRLIDKMEDYCEVINIPLEAGEDDILGRKPGDALFPEIGKDKEWLERTKKIYLGKKGKKSWESLYQGNPTINEGNMIPVGAFQYYLPEDIKRKKFPVKVLSVDTALKSGDDNDYTVCSVWGKYNNDYYMLDIDRGHYEFPDMVRQIKMMYRQYNPSHILVEAKAAGQPVIDVLKREMSGVIPIVPKNDKISRLQSVLGAIESGNVYLPNEHRLLYDFTTECKQFPNGKHDDMVDSMSQALYRLLYKTASTPETQVRPDPFGVFNKPQRDDNDVSGLFGDVKIGGLI